MLGVDVKFDDDDVYERLVLLGPDGWDRAEFGVIELDAELVCTGYSTTEADFAGLDKERVIGKEFFARVGVCMNNFLVSSRYEEGQLDEVIPYTLTVMMEPTPVRLRMLAPAGDGPRYLLVDRTID
ncbi:MAG: phosphonate transporter [Actinomycetota bacterium]